MSVFSTLFQRLIKREKTQKHHNVVLLSSTTSSTITHYMNTLSEHLRALSNNTVLVSTCDAVADPQVYTQFKDSQKNKPADGFIALDSAAGSMLMQLRHLIVLEAPALIVGYEEFILQPLPRRVEGVFLPDNIVETMRFFHKISPQMRKILIVGSRKILTSTSNMTRLVDRLHGAQVQVAFVYLDNEKDSDITRQMHAQAIGADFVFTSFEPLVFIHMKKIVLNAHALGLFVIASHLHAFREGADIAIGYSEGKVFHLLSQYMMLLLHGVTPQEKIAFPVIPLELHCNAQSLMLDHPYTLKNVSSFSTEDDASIYIHTNKQQTDNVSTYF